MPKISQSGVAHLALLLILLTGITAGTIFYINTQKEHYSEPIPYNPPSNAVLEDFSPVKNLRKLATTFCTNKLTGSSISLKEALDIASEGECGQKGIIVKDFSSEVGEDLIVSDSNCSKFPEGVVWSFPYKTFNLDPKYEREDCYNWACYVDVDKKEAFVEFFCGPPPKKEAF